MYYSHTVGVDEVGRGPLAGPVAVGVVCAPAGFNIKCAFPDVADSKKLSASVREDIYKEARERARAGELTFCVRFVGAKAIDTIGITRAVRRGVWSGVRALAPEPAAVQVLLDGLLHAPQEYAQKTIIKGDVTEPIISLASIMAKVRRDKLMERLALQYPHYFFDEHKGYGTRKHYEAIEKWGATAIHRQSFL